MIKKQISKKVFQIKLEKMAATELTLSPEFQEQIILICAIISIIFGLLNVWLVLRVKVDP